MVGILGSTLTGEYEPIQALGHALDKLEQSTGLDIPIHVDAASGGFVAPFLQPDLAWDFQVPRVKSINASGHKYGLAPLGVGWVVWRDQGDLPEDLVFRVNYLGGDMPTFAINFSRPGGQVIVQYYNFIRLGREGYRKVQQSCQNVARYLADEIQKLGPFTLLTRGEDLPVFAWTLKEKTNFTLFELSERLRYRAGRCRPTPCPRIAPTSRCSASWCVTASAGITRTCCSRTCAAPWTPLPRAPNACPSPPRPAVFTIEFTAMFSRMGEPVAAMESG